MRATTTGLFDAELAQMATFGPPPPCREAQQAYIDASPKCECVSDCPGHAVGAEDHAKAREVMQFTQSRINLDFSRPRSDPEAIADGSDDEG